MGCNTFPATGRGWPSAVPDHPDISGPVERLSMGRAIGGDGRDPGQVDGEEPGRSSGAADVGHRIGLVRAHADVQEGHVVLQELVALQADIDVAGAVVEVLHVDRVIDRTLLVVMCWHYED